MEDKIKEIQKLIAEAKAAAENAVKEAKDQSKANEDKLANLDESIKAMNEKLAKIKVEKPAEAKTIGDALRGLFASEKFKTAFAQLKENKAAKISFELETKAPILTTSVTGNVNITAPDTRVYGRSFGNPTFMPRLTSIPVQEGKGKVMFCDGNFTNGTGYVGENQEAGEIGASVTEKYRFLAKIGNVLPFSAEAMTDTGYLVDWAENEGRKAIVSKVDSEILLGDGADSSQPYHIYGIKKYANPFSAEAAGLATAIENADLVALLLACKAQMQKKTFGVYTPDTVFMSFALFAQLANLRGASNDYVGLIKYKNELQNILGVEFVLSDKLTDKQMLVAYMPAAKLHEKNGLEVEFERVAKTDGYNMYLRWRGQVVIPTAEAHAFVWVNDVDTAIAAITKPGA